MNDDEDISEFFIRVDEGFNVMMGLGKTIKESVIVQKILRSLCSKFSPKVSTIEETTNFETPNRYELLGLLTTYEIRISKGNSANICSF